jgi:hypothetical protein
MALSASRPNMKSRIDVLKYVRYMNENECVKEWLGKKMVEDLSARMW